jgi:hypothetical protein
LANSINDLVLGTLMRLLLEEEKRHHGMFLTIAAYLRVALGGVEDRRAHPTGPIAAADIEALRRFRHEELEGEEKLQALADEAPELLDGLFALLLKLISMDSRKHRFILDYVLRELEAVEQEPPESI